MTEHNLSILQGCLSNSSSASDVLGFTEKPWGKLGDKSHQRVNHFLGLSTRSPPLKCPSVSEGGKVRGRYLGVNGVLDQASATWVGHHLSHIDDGPTMPFPWSVTRSPPRREKDALRHYCLNIYSSNFHNTEIN